MGNWELGNWEWGGRWEGSGNGAGPGASINRTTHRKGPGMAGLSWRSAAKSMGNIFILGNTCKLE